MAISSNITVEEILSNFHTGSTETDAFVQFGFPCPDSENIAEDGTTGRPQLTVTGATHYQFDTLTYWPDGGVHFALVSCILPGSFTGGGSSTALTITSGGNGESSSTDMGTDNTSYLTIDTGDFDCDVSVDNFNLLKRVQVGATECFDSTADNIEAYDLNFRQALSVDQDNCSVTFQYNGPVFTRVKAKGHMALPNGRPTVPFTCYMDFHKGKPKCEVTWMMRNGERAKSAAYAPVNLDTHMQVEYLELKAPMTLGAGNPGVKVAGHSSEFTGTLTSGDAYIYQSAAHYYTPSGTPNYATSVYSTSLNGANTGNHVAKIPRNRSARVACRLELTENPDPGSWFEIYDGDGVQQIYEVVESGQSPTISGAIGVNRSINTLFTAQTFCQQLVANSGYDCYVLQAWEGDIIEISSGSAGPPNQTLNTFSTRGIMIGHAWAVRYNPSFKWREEGYEAKIGATTHNALGDGRDIPRAHYAQVNGSAASCTVAVEDAENFYNMSAEVHFDGTCTAGLWSQKGMGQCTVQHEHSDSRKCVFWFAENGSEPTPIDVARRLNAPLFGRPTDYTDYRDGHVCEYEVLTVAEQNAIYSDMGLSHTVSTSDTSFYFPMAYVGASQSGGENNNDWYRDDLLRHLRMGTPAIFKQALKSLLWKSMEQVRWTDDFDATQSPFTYNLYTEVTSNTTGDLDHRYREGIILCFLLTGDSRYEDALVEELDELNKRYDDNYFGNTRSFSMRMRAGAAVTRFFEDRGNTNAELQTNVSTALNLINTIATDDSFLPSDDSNPPKLGWEDSNPSVYDTGKFINNGDTDEPWPIDFSTGEGPYYRGVIPSGELFNVWVTSTGTPPTPLIFDMNELQQIGGMPSNEVDGRLRSDFDATGQQVSRYSNSWYGKAGVPIIEDEYFMMHGFFFYDKFPMMYYHHLEYADRYGLGIASQTRQRMTMYGLYLLNYWLTTEDDVNQWMPTDRWCGGPTNQHMAYDINGWVHSPLVAFGESFSQNKNPGFIDATTNIYTAFEWREANLSYSENWNKWDERADNQHGLYKMFVETPVTPGQNEAYCAISINRDVALSSTATVGNTADVAIEMSSNLGVSSTAEVGDTPGNQQLPLTETNGRRTILRRNIWDLGQNFFEESLPVDDTNFPVYGGSGSDYPQGREIQLKIEQTSARKTFERIDFRWAGFNRPPDFTEE